MGPQALLELQKGLRRHEAGCLSLLLGSLPLAVGPGGGGVAGGENFLLLSSRNVGGDLAVGSGHLILNYNVNCHDILNYHDYHGKKPCEN